MVDWTCQCAGTGWVCEVHHLVPWRNGEGCCGAAGMPCSQCNATFPPRYAPDTYQIGFDDEPRAAAPMPLLDQPSIRSQVSRYTFVPRTRMPMAISDLDFIESMKISGTPERVVLDYEEPFEPFTYDLVRDSIPSWQHTDFPSITRNLLERKLGRTTMETYVDDLIRGRWKREQERALNELYHELGITREDP